MTEAAEMIITSEVGTVREVITVVLFEESSVSFSVRLLFSVQFKLTKIHLAGALAHCAQIILGLQ